MKLLKNLNKKTTIIISLIIVGMLSVGIGIAFLQDHTQVLTNIFGLASIDTEIEEDIVEGDLTKEPKVVSTDKSETDAMVRIRLNISNVEVFSKYFGLKGIDTAENNSGTTNNEEGTYWIKDSNSIDKYNAYYYYQHVLQPQGEKHDSTTPLFTQILYKYKENGETKFLPFYVLDDDNQIQGNPVYVLNPDIPTDQKEKATEALSYLNDITITLYQESVPVKVKDWNADANGDGIIDNNTDHATEIWEYFDSKGSITVE